MRAFRRFVARRSTISLMVSDNAAVFTSCAKILKSICQKEQVINSLNFLRVDWKFIPARSPPFGGVCERLIGLTKLALKKVLGRALVSSSDFNTVIYEIESLLNDRILTYETDGINEYRSITLSHLLYGRRLRSIAGAGVDLQEVSDPSVRASNIYEERIKIATFICSILEHVERRLYKVIMGE